MQRLFVAEAKNPRGDSLWFVVGIQAIHWRACFPTGPTQRGLFRAKKNKQPRKPNFLGKASLPCLNRGPPESYGQVSAERNVRRRACGCFLWASPSTHPQSPFKTQTTASPWSRPLQTSTLISWLLLHSCTCQVALYWHLCT